MSAARWMLDTNTVSFIIRGTSAALRERLRLAPMHQLCISAVTEGELLYGLARKPQATALHRAVQAFVQHLEVLPWDSAAAQRYGELRCSLEAVGQPLGGLDTMIAAHALACGCVLVSNDQAFRRVPGARVEDWLVA
jgi:tRNA(fMet)-specific endonuclease VapC